MLRGTRELLIVGDRPSQTYGWATKVFPDEAVDDVRGDVLFSLAAATTAVVLQNDIDTIMLRKLAMLGVPMVIPAALAAEFAALGVEHNIVIAVGGDAAAIAEATNLLTHDRARLSRFDEDRGQTAKKLWSISTNESRLSAFAELLAALARRSHPATSVSVQEPVSVPELVSVPEYVSDPESVSRLLRTA